MNQLKSWWRRSALLLLVAGVLALMLPALQAGLASLYYFPAQFRLDQWNKSSDKPAADDLAHTAELVANAVRLQPDNPHYLLLSAKVNEWRWYSGVLSSTDILANEQLYQRAIAMRPSWPVAYADYAYFLAITQFRLTDAWQQLELASKHGAYLPQVQQKYLAIAFSFWSSLTVAQKAQVFQRLEAGFSGALFGVTRAAVVQAGQQQQVCRYLRLKQPDGIVWQRVRTNMCARYQ